MIICYFYIVRITFMPFKTNPPLPVDTYGILPFSISPQSMKFITRIKHQRFKAWSGSETRVHLKAVVVRFCYLLEPLLHAILCRVLPLL